MSETPNWIKAENQKFDAKKEQQEKESQQSAEEAMFVSKHNADGWKHFIEAVSTNASALQELKGRNLDGKASMHGPEACLFQISLQGNIGTQNSQLYTFYYHPTGIRIAPPFGSTSRETFWEFRPLPDKTGVGILVEGRVVTPEEFAEGLIKKLIENVERPVVYV